MWLHFVTFTLHLDKGLSPSRQGKNCSSKVKALIIVSVCGLQLLFCLRPHLHALQDASLPITSREALVLEKFTAVTSARMNCNLHCKARALIDNITVMPRLG